VTASKCKLLNGENLVPLTAEKAKKLIGHRIRYLRGSDIDKSGRGHFFPRGGVVVGSFGRNLEIDSEGNFIRFYSLVELVDEGVDQAGGQA
jgi:hypothetical protein